MLENDLLDVADDCHFLPGLRLTNVFRLVSRANAGVNDAVESRIQNANGLIDEWKMARRGEVLEHRIVVSGLGECEARALRDELKCLDGNLKSQLEHLFVLRSDHLSR